MGNETDKDVTIIIEKGTRAKRSIKKPKPSNKHDIRKTHNQAYEPWTIQADEKLVLLFRQGKTAKELSEIFGRTNGAIRSRINKLLLE